MWGWPDGKYTEADQYKRAKKTKQVLLLQRYLVLTEVRNNTYKRQRGHAQIRTGLLCMIKSRKHNCR